MAIHYGADAQKLKNAQTIGDHNYFRQALDCMIYKETYTVKGTELVGEEVFLSREFPAGTVVIPVLSKVHVVSDPGTTLTGDLGFNAIDDFLDGVALGAVGVVQPTEREIVIEVAVQPKFTFTVVSSLTANAEIDFYFAVRQTS